MSKENPSKSSPVRIGHSLNDDEKDHVSSRRESVLQCLLQNNIHCSLKEVPNIALLGSGGGERAMLGLMASLLQLYKDGLLNCIMYLCGVSGSTWCMASLYKEPDWSSRLEEVKDDVIQRLTGDGVGCMEKLSLLEKYYKKDNFSLTDIWAALVVSEMVKEIDEYPLSHQRNQHKNDPYPIYTVIDKQSNHEKMKADVFLEITPHEVGYSITGAFVDATCFGCQFDDGVKMRNQPEMDMFYLQGLCGSNLADFGKIMEELLTIIKKLFRFETTKTCNHASLSPSHVNEIYRVTLTLVELNLLLFREKDTSSHIKILQELLRGSLNEEEYETVEVSLQISEEISKKEIQEQTLFVCQKYSDWLQEQLNYNGPWMVVIKCIELVSRWIWGTTYNFLYNMTAPEVSPCILKEETRHYEDAGIFINSPYFSILRKERQTDLIISLDFSDNGPFENTKEDILENVAYEQCLDITFILCTQKTVVKTAKTCKELHIPFPKVHISEKDKHAPKDFYVFESDDAPTVIHIPLFNIINCEGELRKWKKRYTTWQRPYSCELIHDLLEKAEVNIKNNKVKILREIQKVINKKTANLTMH